MSKAIPKRDSEEPKFIQYARDLRSPHRWRTHKLNDQDTVLRCQSGAWESIGGYEIKDRFSEQAWVKRQSRFGWIEKDKQSIGAYQAIRYEMPVLMGTDEIVNIKDIDNHHEAELSTVLGDAWFQVGMDVAD